MDDKTFDHLARRFEKLVSRRGAIGVLAGAGVLFTCGAPHLEVVAKRKKKRKCKPESLAATCEGKCGSVKNNCKKRVTCGCSFCERCGANKACEPDPDKLGDECGSAGRICLGDGSCACDPDPDSCGAGKVCLAGSCQDCGFLDAPCCSSNNCPQAGTGCFAGICEECGGTGEQCCPNRICEPGRVCLGAGVGTCQDCGISGQPCCDTGAACLFGATCVSGTCQD